MTRNSVTAYGDDQVGELGLRLELKLRAVALVLGLGREAAAPAAIYEELDVRFKPTKASERRRTPSSCDRLGYEREEEEDTAYMRARNVSQRKGRKGEAGLRLWPIGLAQYATRGQERLACWLRA
jgi:hypothetical protein